jgi:titin
LENRLLPSTFTVVTNQDNGPGSLRDAIMKVDQDLKAGTDTINFAIGSGTTTIALASALPAITHPVIIDGTTQPGFSGTPLIELDGAGAGSGVNGLDINAGGSTVQGVAINRFDQDGILLEGTGGDKIRGDFIGLDISGTLRLGNGNNGVEINGIANDIIGGPKIGDRNIISGNLGQGILISGGPNNVVEGNFIGTDISGTQALGNANDGVLISGSNDIVGGTTPNARNIISANGASGVALGFFAANNLVEGNYLGTDVTGEAALGNSIAGATLVFSFNNTIGGSSPGAGNLISGNQFAGVFATFEASNNLIQGNRIGTDATGTQALGNAEIGVDLNFAGNNTIGGTTLGARNVISGNGIEGVDFCGSFGNMLEGNFIGTDVTGMHAVGNVTYGVDMGSVPANNTIGGTSPGARNVISGNGSDGVLLRPGTETTLIEGNLIGTNAKGTDALGNGGDGIRSFGGDGTTIGGTTAGARNVISGNENDGIELIGGFMNVVEDNYIGTDKAGAKSLGNLANGVELSSGEISTQIGWDHRGRRKCHLGQR